jgi:hypothetical protein
VLDLRAAIDRRGTDVLDPAQRTAFPSVEITDHAIAFSGIGVPLAA